jgi:hypothetical protein
MIWFRKLFYVLTTGATCVFASEHLFWARIKPSDQVWEWVLGWLFYSCGVWLCLSVISFFRVHTLAGLFLIGALYGWTMEGVLVQTAYDHFPVQISWTGLAWHATLSICVSWYFMQRALQSSRAWASHAMAAAIGLFWAFWGVFWRWDEPMPSDTTTSFAAFVILFTLLYGLAHYLQNRVLFRCMRFGPWSLLISSGIVLAYFIFITVKLQPKAAVIFPILMLLVIVPLWYARGKPREDLLLDQLAKPFPVSRLMAFAWMPVMAVSFYYFVESQNLKFPSNQIVYFISTPLGFVLLVTSIFKIIKYGRSTRLPAGSSPSSSRDHESDAPPLDG